MALHPGEAGYDEQFDSRAKRAETKRDGHGDGTHIYEIADTLKELQAEAAKPCRCDGGNNDCGPCRAERKLRTMGENCGMCHQPGCRFCFPKGTTVKKPSEKPKHNINYDWSNVDKPVRAEVTLHFANSIGRTTLDVSMLEISRTTDAYSIKLTGNNVETKEEKPKHPVGVSVLVTDSEGRLLLGRRKGADAAGLLSTPGGRLENETIAECGARELREECGVLVNNLALKQIGVAEHFRFGKHYIMFYLHLQWIGDQVIQNMEPDKCEGWDWYRMIDLSATDTTEPPYILARLATILAGW